MLHEKQTENVVAAVISHSRNAFSKKRKSCNNKTFRFPLVAYGQTEKETNSRSRKAAIE